MSVGSRPGSAHGCRACTSSISPWKFSPYVFAGPGGSTRLDRPGAADAAGAPMPCKAQQGSSPRRRKMRPGPHRARPRPSDVVEVAAGAPPPGSGVSTSRSGNTSGCRCMTARQPPCDTAGLIHPTTSSPPTTQARATATCTLFDPLNDFIAYRPCVDHAAPPANDPVFPFPDTSATVVPDPASNRYTTKPGGTGGAAGVTTLTTLENALRFPAASTAANPIAVARRGGAVDVEVARGRRL